MISAIVAVDNNYGIGFNNKLLVNIPEDMKMFKQLTSNNIIIMGRNTFNSLPKKPLPNRVNIVITSTAKGYDQNNNIIYTDMEDAKYLLSNTMENKDIFIIGGESIYKELLPFCQRLHITKVYHSYDNVDTYFPNIDKTNEWCVSSISEIKEYNNIQYQFCIYDRIITMKG